MKQLLQLNDDKTKFIDLNLSFQGSIKVLDGAAIKQVTDFKYLGRYTNIANDMKVRIGQPWGAINSLNKILNAQIKKETKIGVFKQTVKSIHLYGSEPWITKIH